MHAAAIIEHVIAVLLIVVAPLYAKVRFDRLVRTEDPDGRLRRRAYRDTIMRQWLLAVAAVWAAIANGRSWVDLGFAPPAGWGFLGATGLFALFVTLLLLQLHAFLRGAIGLDVVLVKLGAVRKLLPRDARDLRLFGVLALTAGVCEEVLFRGFLVAYLATWMPWPVALAASCVVFGVAHLYQGGAGILKTGAAGAAMAGLYALSGSLWIGMIAHAILDLNAGLLAQRALAVAGGKKGSPDVATSRLPSQADENVVV